MFQDLLAIPPPTIVEEDVSSIMGLERREGDMDTSERYVQTFFFLSVFLRIFFHSFVFFPRMDDRGTCLFQQQRSLFTQRTTMSVTAN